ncbi:MAG TPA: hypothetical protein VMS22_11020 [Candidatus Eisenbacteria bacterium]|nr:hypothetical protein [Candidatus Eisenbacteria bacterium]
MLHEPAGSPRGAAVVCHPHPQYGGDMDSSVVVAVADALVGAGFVALRFNSRRIPRFPAGLAGAQAVSFTLGRGVPMPAGDPGHSCVISEETGLSLANERLCRAFRDLE